MEKLSQQIFVKFQKEGIHKYPQALTDPLLAEVSFLGYPHRHIFNFCVWIDVYHDDREIEFILFKRWLESLYADNILQLDYTSCEMLSDQLAEQISIKYGKDPNKLRNLKIEVSEDDENGSSSHYII